MSNLYDINVKFLQAIAKLEAAETETEYYEAEVELAAVDSERDEKLEACVCYLKNLRGRIALYQNEITRLSKEVDRMQEHEERFEKYLKSSIPEGEKWSRGVHSIGWRKSEAVKVLDLTRVPGPYLREKLYYEPDLKAIKKDIECGLKVDWAVIEKRNNIQIK